MTDELSERLLSEATARVTWGDSPETVMEYLISQGMDAGEAAAMVNRLVRERNEEVRARSRRRLGIGVAALAAVTVFFAFLPWRDWYSYLDQFHFGGGRRRTSLGDLLVFGFCCVGGTGVWFTWRGFWGLVAPQAEELTDVE